MECVRATWGKQRIRYRSRIACRKYRFFRYAPLKLIYTQYLI